MQTQFPVLPYGKDVFVQHIPEVHEEVVSGFSLSPFRPRMDPINTKSVIGSLHGGKWHNRWMIVGGLEREILGIVNKAVTNPAIRDSGGRLASVYTRYVIDGFSPGYIGRDSQLDKHPSSLRVDDGLSIQHRSLSAVSSGLSGFLSLSGLFGNRHEGQENSPCCRSVGPSEKAVPTWEVPFGILYVFLGMLFVRFSGDSRLVKLCGFLCALLGGAFILDGYVDCKPAENSENRQIFQHDWKIVQQKLLTLSSFSYTVIARSAMANVLNNDKQIAIIGQLAEGSSIRSIERITGVHRDTIMRLGVKVGQGCMSLMDAQMRNLPCRRLELDEIWGFVGKKDRQVRRGDSMEVGSIWTWCAIDAETKLVPAFHVGDRSAASATAFLRDVADRMAYRVQISTDGLTAYVDAVEKAFGADVDYAQIIKTYGHEETTDNRRYSAPEFVSSEKKIIAGRPDVDLISTSYVERLNATTRLHMRRLTRLTLAFSKKRENFEAAVGLHFAYYNFVKRHNTLRCTPAMAAGVTGSFWSVADLVEAAA